MKNVKVILIGVALCATVFANSRISALGGDAGFWAGDRANVGSFPATINDQTRRPLPLRLTEQLLDCTITICTYSCHFRPVT